MKMKNHLLFSYFTNVNCFFSETYNQFLKQQEEFILLSMSRANNSDIYPSQHQNFSENGMLS